MTSESIEFMDAQVQAKLKQHMDAIADILYQEANPKEIQTLEGIEKTVRALAQEHVLPQLGIFLSTASQKAVRGKSEL